MATYMFPNEVTVTIGAADAVSSAAENVDFTTFLSNFNQTGGGADTESIPLFGNAFINNEKPRDLIEVSFDAVLTYEQALLFDQLIMGSTLDGSTATDSSETADPKVIYVEQNNGSNYYTRAYNNASGFTFEPEMAADEYMKGTITFKLSPTDGAAAANLKTVKAAATTITW